MKRTQAANAMNSAAQADKLPPNTIQFALSSHRVFKTIALFLQGLFAGMALWQIIASFTLIVSGVSVFSLYYMILGIPVQCIYFLLFAFATVAALDRSVECDLCYFLIPMNCCGNN